MRMRYLDASRIAADWICPRSRYWGYEFEGGGITPIEPNADLQFGQRIAAQVQRIRDKQPLVAAEATNEGVLEMGLLLAYTSTIWPLWDAEYEVIATELECAQPLGSALTYLARPDAVLRRRSDGTIWVLSDKTTSLPAATFCQQWQKAVQNHAECVLVEHQLGVTVSGYFTQGWYKGYKKADTIYSPLAFAWCRQGATALTKDVWLAEYKYGWPRRRIDAYPGGIAAWIRQLPAELIHAQFPVAGPTLLRRDMVEAYLTQVTIRDETIVDGQGQRELDIQKQLSWLYPQHFANCDEYGKYRRPCAFRECCWVPSIGLDPLASGLYIKRIPHHDQERLTQAN